MLTNKDYCDYDTSVALYALGYDCQVIHLIAEKITLYEAQKWLREEKKIIVTVNYYCKSQDYNSHWFWAIFTNDKRQKISSTINYSYEEALSEGIKKAIKHLKDGIGKQEV